MKSFGVALVTASMVILVAGCADLEGIEAPPAVISDVNDSSVKIQGAPSTPREEIAAEANRACGIYGKQAVSMDSVRCAVPSEYGWCSREEHLFACQ